MALEYQEAISLRLQSHKFCGYDLTFEKTGNVVEVSRYGGVCAGINVLFHIDFQDDETQIKCTSMQAGFTVPHFCGSYWWGGWRWSRNHVPEEAGFKTSIKSVNATDFIAATKAIAKIIKQSEGPSRFLTESERVQYNEVISIIRKELDLK